MEKLKKPLLIVLLGPTAVGKTKVAIELAKRYNSCIISSDSRQFYKQMRIGTARPAEDELAAAEHHFIGFLEITEPYSAGKFEKEALEFLELYFQKNKIAIMAGGSGLYAEAVCEGLDDLPVDDETRQELIQLFEEQGIEKLQSMLFESDPEYYEKVDKKNPQRLIRALEVIKLSGNTYSSMRIGKSTERSFDCIKIALDMPREMLYARIDQRVHQMMKEGLLDEVKSLLTHKDLNALNTVGYKELFEFLEGNCTEAEAIEQIQKNTRRFAKRQLTWLRRLPELHWVHLTSDERAVEDIARLVEDYISGNLIPQTSMQD